MYSNKRELFSAFPIDADRARDVAAQPGIDPISTNSCSTGISLKMGTLTAVEATTRIPAQTEMHESGNRRSRRKRPANTTGLGL